MSLWVVVQKHVCEGQKTSVQEPVLFFDHEGPRNQTRVIRAFAM